jgi:hypothetical protein
VRDGVCVCVCVCVCVHAERIIAAEGLLTRVDLEEVHGAGGFCPTLCAQQQRMHITRVMHIPLQKRLQRVLLRLTVLCKGE